MHCVNLNSCYRFATKESMKQVQTLVLLRLLKYTLDSDFASKVPWLEKDSFNLFQINFLKFCANMPPERFDLFEIISIIIINSAYRSLIFDRFEAGKIFDFVADRYMYL